MAECRAVIVLFSQAFMDSRPCMLELGTVWALCQNIYPLYVSPIREDYGCTALAELPVRSVADVSDLMNLLRNLQLLDCCYDNPENLEENVTRFRDDALKLLFRRYGRDFRSIITHIPWTIVQ